MILLKHRNTGKIIEGCEMGKSISFDTYLIEEFLKDRQQAEAYLKEAIEEGDLQLLQMSIENLIKAGYGSFAITSKDLLTPTDIQLKQQTLEAKI